MQRRKAITPPIPSTSKTPLLGSGTTDASAWPPSPSEPLILKLEP